MLVYKHTSPLLLYNRERQRHSGFKALRNEYSHTYNVEESSSNTVDSSRGRMHLSSCWKTNVSECDVNYLRVG